MYKIMDFYEDLVINYNKSVTGQCLQIDKNKKRIEKPDPLLYDSSKMTIRGIHR